MQSDWSIAKIIAIYELYITENKLIIYLVGEL